MTVVLAVDGGATKTEAELRDASGTVLARARTGPCNLYQHPEGAMAAIREAWVDCARGGGAEAARTVLSVAAAGANAAEGQARFYAATQDFAAAHLSSDAFGALVGAFDGGPGVLLSVGTGTVACRRDADGGFLQLGGWGFPIGDQGGGAWMGLQLVGAWLQRRDGSVASTPSDRALWHELEHRLGGDRGTILAWLRAATPAAFASLAPLLLAQADAGSPVACGIKAAAADHLARLIRALVPQRGAEIALAGSLAPAFADRLAASLDTRLASYPASALRGAWLIGTGHARPEFQPPG